MSDRSDTNKLWLTFYGELIGSWIRRADSRQDAEDVTHDAVLHLLESNTSTILNPKAYLHQSVRNRLIDKHRRTLIMDIVPLHELKEDLHPVLTDPDTQVRTTQLLESLKMALAELPLKCRQVFLLHKLEGYSQQEIAQQLGISVNMVEKHMMRAARYLRERLQKHASQ